MNVITVTDRLWLKLLIRLLQFMVYGWIKTREFKLRRSAEKHRAFKFTNSKENNKNNYYYDGFPVYRELHYCLYNLNKI